MQSDIEKCGQVQGIIILVSYDMPILQSINNQVIETINTSIKWAGVGPL